MSWRHITDWAKRSDRMLRVADRLGRGTGRFRIVDGLHRPPPCAIKPDLTGWENHTLAAAWLGHATVLLRIDGVTVLTDPVMSARVGLGVGLATVGPLRQVAAALTVRQLPPLDLILISHAHFDHLDRPTLRRLPKTVPVVTARGTADLVADLGFGSVTELGWNESTDLGPLRLTARPVKHWGARTFTDSYRGYNAYLLETTKNRVLYGGDTAYTDSFRDLSDIDLAIFGIGAYDPYIAAHATPEQAMAMARQCGARFVLPIHHSTFRLSHEPRREPIERMLRAAGGNSDRIVIRDVGQTWVAPASPNGQIIQP